MKEYCRAFGGSHNIKTLASDILEAVQNAHSKYNARKKEEYEEKRIKLATEKEKFEEEQRQKEILKKVEKKKDALDKKEQQLELDEAKTDNEQEVAQKMLEDATKSLDLAIGKGDMLGIKVAKEMLEAAKKRFSEISVHQNEQKVIRNKISQKRKSDLTKLVNTVIKKKK